jgi:hypothetical protein
MTAHVLPTLLVIAVVYTMLWTAVAKKQVVVVCRTCRQPRERCRCARGPVRRRP